MSETKRILVTGGTGFIGHYVVGRLRSQGLEPIVTTSSGDLPCAHPFDAISLDLTDEMAIERVISSVRPEIVLHLGGVTGAGTSPERCHSVNYIGTVNLLKALGNSDLARVVLLGTAAEYGDQKTPFREKMAVKPVSAYALSKARANEFALGLFQQHGFPVTILRVFTAYGPGQPRKMFLSQLISHALLNQCFKMSDGDQRRDLVYVGDVSKAITDAMRAPKALGRIINIAGGQAIRLRDLARRVWTACGGDLNLLQIGSLDKASDDAFDTEADISLAAELIGWRPETPFIGRAEPGHPLFDMIDRTREEIGRSASGAATCQPAQ